MRDVLRPVNFYRDKWRAFDERRTAMTDSKTLELVNGNKVMLAIMEVAENAGLNVMSADSHSVKIKAGCLPVEISWEMCSCHGGRLWFNQDNTNIHIELSSDEYDEENGIDSPKTELAWRIDNELVDTVKRFESFVHVVDERGSYGNPDREERRYFDSVEKAAKFIFEEDGHDLLSEYGEVLHQYPNRDIRMRIAYDGDKSEEYSKARRLRFICERLVRKDGEFEVDYSFTREYWMYRKGLR